MNLFICLMYWTITFSEFRPWNNESCASADREDRLLLWSAFSLILPYKVMKFDLPDLHWCNCSGATVYALVEHKHPVTALCNETINMFFLLCQIVLNVELLRLLFVKRLFCLFMLMKEFHVCCHVKLKIAQHKLILLSMAECQKQ